MELWGVETSDARMGAYDLFWYVAKEQWNLEKDATIKRGERGKPYLPDYPEYHFNLSHSGTLALCGLSNQSVGVDIQVQRSFRPGLIKRCCSQRELEWLDQQADKQGAFGVLWTLKEALGKQSGYGLPYPPSKLEVPLPQSGALFSNDKVYRQDGLLFRVYWGKDWCGAACGLEPPPEKIIWKI